MSPLRSSFGIPAVNSRLVLFDTSIVDVTDYCTDPVETLMKVQLGGGTDVGQALAYAGKQSRQSTAHHHVLITDFFEGAPLANLFATTKTIGRKRRGASRAGSVRDSDANPLFDRGTASRMASLGAHVGAMSAGRTGDVRGERK